MAEYKVAYVSPGCNCAGLSRDDGETIDIHVPGLCGVNRALRFDFSGEILTIKDELDSGFNVVYDLTGSSYGGYVEPISS